MTDIEPIDYRDLVSEEPSSEKELPFKPKKRSRFNSLKVLWVTTNKKVKWELGILIGAVLGIIVVVALYLTGR